MTIGLILKWVAVLLGIIILVYLFSLAELFTQVSRYQKYWDKQNSKQHSSENILYIAVGDSAAQGVGASHPSKGYVSLVAAELERKHDRKVDTVNLSKSGAVIRDVINQQLPVMRTLPVDTKTVITVDIGANDMGGFDPVQFRKDARELMGELPGQAVISDVPYFGGSIYKGRQDSVNQANEIMRSVAGEYGFKLAPLHDKIKNNNSLLIYAADLFHPSNKSYREIWTPVFMDGIQSNGVHPRS